MRGRFITYRQGSESWKVELGGWFAGFGLLPKRVAVDHMRNYYTGGILDINIAEITFGDLEALSSIWKFIDTTNICVGAEWGDKRADEAHEKITFITHMLRCATTRKPRIAIDWSFTQHRLAPFFGDFVFEYAYLCGRHEYRGADLPLCRSFRFQDERSGLVIDGSDPFVPFVRKLSYFRSDHVLASHAVFTPTCLFVVVDDLVECDTLARMFPGVEKLDVNWVQEHDALVATFIRSMRHVRTLSLCDRGGNGRDMPDAISDAIASLPSLERLFLRTPPNSKWTFLLRLPRLRKLRVYKNKVGTFHANTVSMLPHLETFVTLSGASMRELNKTRAEISHRRALFLGTTLRIYDMLERSITADVATMILLMANNAKAHACIREAIRSRPSLARLNAEWNEKK